MSQYNALLSNATGQVPTQNKLDFMSSSNYDMLDVINENDDAIYDLIESELQKNPRTLESLFNEKTNNK
jgi:hypothetical protein